MGCASFLGHLCTSFVKHQLVSQLCQLSGRAGNYNKEETRMSINSVAAVLRYAIRKSSFFAAAITILVATFATLLVISASPASAHHNETEATRDMTPQEAVRVDIKTVRQYVPEYIQGCQSYSPFSCISWETKVTYMLTFSDNKNGDNHCAVLYADGRRHLSCYGSKTIAVSNPYLTRVCISGRYNPCAESYHWDTWY